MAMAMAMAAMSRMRAASAVGPCYPAPELARSFARRRTLAISAVPEQHHQIQDSTKQCALEGFGPPDQG